MSLQFIKKLTFLMSLMLFVGSSLWAADVTLDSGYLTGKITMGQYSVASFNINATGGGYSSYQNTTGTDSYSLTVQGGPWDYKLTSSGAVTDTSGVNTYLGFTERYLQVNPATTVVNDYSYNPGIVRYEVSINGDAYSYWTAYSGAQNVLSSGVERTYSSTGTPKYLGDHSWEMPVVPNQGIALTAKVYIRDPGNGTYQSFSFDFGLRDIAPGETVIIPIQIDYVAPTPVPTPPPTSTTSYFGYVEGTAWLQGVPEELVWAHLFYDNGGNRVGGTSGRSANRNPGIYKAGFRSTNPDYSFLTTLRVGTYFLDPVTGSNTGGQFSWPYLGGLPENNQVQVTMGQTAYKDFILETGVLAGALNLSGPLAINDLTSANLSFTGSSTLSNGGWSYGSFGLSTPAASLKLFLSEGEWKPVYFNLYRTVADNNSYTSSLSVSYADQATLLADFGWLALPYVLPNQTTTQDIDYCLGDVIYRFRDSSGGLLSRPTVSGTGSRTVNGTRVLTTNVRSSSQALQAASPEVEIFGPSGDYTLTSGVTAADGTYIRYPAMQKTLTCGVREIIDIPGPVLQVASPAAGLISNAASLPVSGQAASGSTISSLTVDGQATTLVPTTATGTQVDFSFDLPLANGSNTIVTQVVDASGAQASDTRTIYIDRWLPEVVIETPLSGATAWQEEGAVQVAVSAADQGYGYTLTVYLDGQAIHQVDGAADENQPVSSVFSRSYASLPDGQHQLLAVVEDLAGNRTETETLFAILHDSWVPTVTTNLPTQGSLFNGLDSAIALSATGADQGAGFSMSVSLDGVEIYQAAGSASANTPVALDFNASTGPLTSGRHLLSASVADRVAQTANAQSEFFVDGWLPSVAIVAPLPAINYSYTETIIPLQVEAADQGYGYTLEVYLDGVLLAQQAGPVDDQMPAAVTFTDQHASMSPGQYRLVAIVTDAAGNQAQTEQLISVIDDVAPVLTLSGADPFTLSAGSIYQEPGATAIDTIDGDLTAAIIISGLVDSSVPGDYLLSYSVTDQAGNSASLSRTVTVTQAANEGCEDRDDEDHDRKDHDREDHDREDHDREDHDREDHDREDHDREDHDREDHDREDHDREDHDREDHA